jgi:hypothetical protein
MRDGARAVLKYTKTEARIRLYRMAHITHALAAHRQRAAGSQPRVGDDRRRAGGPHRSPITITPNCALRAVAILRLPIRPRVLAPCSSLTRGRTMLASVLSAAAVFNPSWLPQFGRPALYTTDTLADWSAAESSGFEGLLVKRPFEGKWDEFQCDSPRNRNACSPAPPLRPRLIGEAFSTSHPLAKYL